MKKSVTLLLFIFYLNVSAQEISPYLLSQNLWLASKSNNDSEILSISSAKNIKANYKGKSKPNSTRLLKFNIHGEQLRDITYDLEMAINNLPPKTIN